MYISKARLYQAQGTYVVAFGKAIGHTLASRIQRHVSFFGTGQPAVHVEEGMLKMHQPGLRRIGYRLCGSAWL